MRTQRAAFSSHHHRRLPCKQLPYSMMPRVCVGRTNINATLYMQARPTVRRCGTTDRYLSSRVFELPVILSLGHSSARFFERQSILRLGHSSAPSMRSKCQSFSGESYLPAYSLQFPFICRSLHFTVPPIMPSALPLGLLNVAVSPPSSGEAGLELTRI